MRTDKYERYLILCRLTFAPLGFHEVEFVCRCTLNSQHWFLYVCTLG